MDVNPANIGCGPELNASAGEGFFSNQMFQWVVDQALFIWLAAMIASLIISFMQFTFRIDDNIKVKLRRTPFSFRNMVW